MTPPPVMWHQYPPWRPPARSAGELQFHLMKRKFSRLLQRAVVSEHDTYQTLAVPMNDECLS